MMNLTEKGCFAELLKAELMERYGLREDQVRLQLTVCTPDLELGRKILSDYDKHQGDSYLPEGNDCDYVTGENINAVYVHRKDGFYGTYVNNNDEA